ncbi:hypothetical protein ACHAXH_001982 [Discostella pseudostelligera]
MKIKTTLCIIGYFLLNLIDSITFVSAQRGAKASKTTKLVPHSYIMKNEDYFYIMKNKDYGEVDHTKYNVDLSLQVMNLAVNKGIAQGIDRWMNIIVGDLPDVDNTDGKYYVDEYFCTEIPYPSVIDDTYLCVIEGEIDGAGRDGESNILGFYAYGNLRPDTGLPFEGAIGFDTYNAAQLLAQPGHWEAYILSMMGYYIGFTLLISVDGPTDFLLNNPTVTYIGENGLRVWQQDWGCSGTPPLIVDVSAEYPTVFWDSACLVNELFTENFNLEGKLSKLTIAAFEDMGYEVDYSAADQYDVADILCCNVGAGGTLTGAKQASPTQGPVLSEAGKAYATTYGFKVLDEKREELASRRRLQLGNIFTGVDEEMTARTNNSITVIIEENGIIFDVTVSE